MILRILLCAFAIHCWIHLGLLNSFHFQIDFLNLIFKPLEHFLHHFLVPPNIFLVWSTLVGHLPSSPTVRRSPFFSLFINWHTHKYNTWSPRIKLLKTLNLRKIEKKGIDRMKSRENARKPFSWPRIYCNSEWSLLTSNIPLSPRWTSPNVPSKCSGNWK